MCGDQPPEPPAHGQSLGPVDQLIGHSAVFESRVDAEATEGEAVVFSLDDDIPRDLAVDLADENVGAVEQIQKLRGVVALRMPGRRREGVQRLLGEEQEHTAVGVPHGPDLTQRTFHGGLP